MSTPLQPNPAKECPRWNRCSVNRCPLDPGYTAFPVDSADLERKCPMEKNVRRRIGQKYPELLPLLGLTAAEAAGLAKWNNMTLEERAALAQRGLTTLKRLRERPPDP